MIFTLPTTIEKSCGMCTHMRMIGGVKACSLTIEVTDSRVIIIRCDKVAEKDCEFESAW